jgi:hypothetical protein
MLPCQLRLVGSDMLKAACLTVLWLMQPQKIATFFNDRNFSDGGLFPQLCLV